MSLKGICAGEIPLENFFSVVVETSTNISVKLFKGMIQHCFFKEIINSNHLVFRIHIIELGLSCHHFNKICVHIFEKTASKHFCFFVHDHIVLI